MHCHDILAWLTSLKQEERKEGTYSELAVLEVWANMIKMILVVGVTAPADITEEAFPWSAIWQL